MTFAVVLSRAPTSASTSVATPAARFLGSPFRLTVSRSARAHARANFVVRAVDADKVLMDVRSVIAEQLGTELDDVQPDSNFVDLGADSLDTVEIMMALEEKFDLQLEEEGVEKIGTVQQAADLIVGQIS